MVSSLKKLKVKPDLLANIDMLLRVKKGVRVAVGHNTCYPGMCCPDSCYLSICLR